MTAYVRAMSKRSEGTDGGKMFPIGYLGVTMVNHGQEFESNSEFGQCLTSKYYSEGLSLYYEVHAVKDE